MIESAQIRICILDLKPPEESRYYRMVKEFHGVKFANRWTKIIKVPLVPHDP